MSSGKTPDSSRKRTAKRKNGAVDNGAVGAGTEDMFSATSASATTDSATSEPTTLDSTTPSSTATDPSSPDEAAGADKPASRKRAVARTTKRKSKSKAKTKGATLPPAPIDDLDVEAYAEQAYLDYSMYVVRNRALPHITDGLKPVQRRIVYAMHQLGLHAKNKPKKSARTVGDVLGKFHPHGDSACYEAMVLMAQPFSIRYSLILGQGNWGSIDDPKSFAAMRYTEARLTEYADQMLAEIDQGTVDMRDNFDGSVREPVCLPARLPNILLNGSSGIAVGLSTDIPPHNVSEVARVCELMLRRKKPPPLAELRELLPGPDFPGYCTIIASKEELDVLYATGAANLRLRAVYHFEGRQIVFTRLPHQVSIAHITAQLHKLRDAKKIPMVRSYRDESDEENEIRLVVQLNAGSTWQLEECAQHLLAVTELERTYRAQMNVLSLDGRPETMGLIDMLGQWLQWRTDTVRRRIEWRLARIADEVKRIQAFLLIFDNLDQIIAIIRASDEPGPALKSEFGYDDYVIGVILETKLRQLARLEELALRKQLQALGIEQLALQTYINDESRLRSKVRQEITLEAKNFAQDRRSKIIQDTASTALDVRLMIPVVKVTVMLTRHGWVRAGRTGEFDPSQVTLRTGDAWVSLIEARSSEHGYCFDEKGKVFRLGLADLPPVRGPGEPVSKHFRCQPGTLWAGMVEQTCPRVALCSSAGQGFVCPTDRYTTAGSQGRQVMRVPEGAIVLEPQKLPTNTTNTTEDKRYLALITSESLMLIMDITDIPERTSGQGVRLVQLASKSTTKSKNSKDTLIEPPRVLDICTLGEKDKLRLRDAEGKVKTLQPADWQSYIKGRGRRGLLARVHRKSTPISLDTPGSKDSEKLL
ncbi:MAG: DNA topoisomerase IV subunit A [Gammaproteobacteria bacterium]|nr:DNA topoisomerase IV subunit A [Gammaproteobacteria bacterium]